MPKNVSFDCDHCGTVGEHQDGYLGGLPSKFLPIGWYYVMKYPKIEESETLHPEENIFCGIPCLAAWSNTQEP